jgi:glyoxylase-like metal-dependent hydrolase (beta-lactamase superfamily II)
MLEDGDQLDCGGRLLEVHHTPGHAPGHLVFQDPESKAVIAGDMVAGVGTIVISPEDGDLGQYLESLEHLRTLQPSVLLPAHGDPLMHPEAILSFYIAHRHQRTNQIRRALDSAGRASPLDLAPAVYPELKPEIYPLAAIQILSHLRWLAQQGEAHAVSELEWSTTPAPH